MIDEKNKSNGFVYILEVKDIDLPVCKIGMTVRNPFDRCSEINNNSTGDFLWEVAHYVSVDDCKRLETLVHKKLEPLRQKNREFFNITAEVANKALQSIIENQSEIKTVEMTVESEMNSPKQKKRKAKGNQTFRKIDAEYTELLQAFTSQIGVKGKPFGQLNKPTFGMSDNNDGVQWNIAVETDVNLVRLGVNLEGKKYSNWPITDFILSELDNPTIDQVKNDLTKPEYTYIQFMRDAWQVTSRPSIKEWFFGGSVFPFSEMNLKLWLSILKEAQGCLDESKNYRGRKKQTITLANKPKTGEQVRIMDVSPHLTIWTPIELSGDIKANIQEGIESLKPVYEWIKRLTQ